MGPASFTINSLSLPPTPRPALHVLHGFMVSGREQGTLGQESEGLPLSILLPRWYVTSIKSPSRASTGVLNIKMRCICVHTFCERHRSTSQSTELVMTECSRSALSTMAATTCASKHLTCAHGTETLGFRLLYWTAWLWGTCCV